MTNDIFEVTLKKHHPNNLNIIALSIRFENIPREEVLKHALEITEKLGLEFDMNYIIRGYREEL